MCRSMFCAIPCFWRVWDEKARDKMLLFLPVVGLETGAIWALLAWLCRYLALPALVQGAVLGAYPFVVTGFIHLDGFMDVTDAVIVTHGGVIAAIMAHLVPEGKNRYEWQSPNGGGYVIEDGEYAPFSPR